MSLRTTGRAVIARSEHGCKSEFTFALLTDKKPTTAVFARKRLLVPIYDEHIPLLVVISIP